MLGRPVGVRTGFPYVAEPTADSQGELAVATSGSHNLRRP
jgi:hypothetical protein